MRYTHASGGIPRAELSGVRESSCDGAVHQIALAKVQQVSGVVKHPVLNPFSSLVPTWGRNTWS